MQDVMVVLITIVLQSRSLAALPAVIRDAHTSGSLEESCDRMRYALKELVQMSLVAYSKANDTYSMHPIVSHWARQRPGMRLSEQAYWSEVAANLLSASILIPPMRNNISDEEYLRAAIPHVTHVQSCRDAINHRMNAEVDTRWKAWYLPQSGQLSPQRAMISAKFSLVYAHYGYFRQAQGLLSSLKDYFAKMLGLEHKRTRRVTLLLAKIYIGMSQAIHAEKLQRSVLDTCLTTLGFDHLDTWKAKAVLGATLWQQGLITEARELQEEALRAFERLLGRDNEETLDAMDNLGRTISRFWERENLEEAMKLHKHAVVGMEKLHGPGHLRALWAKENVARLSVSLGDHNLDDAERIIEYVLKERTKILGKEHIYTLLAICNVAIVKSALGKLSEAEALIYRGLPIAERNMGKEHIGTLLGYHTLGSIRIRQQRYAEAEEILVNVVDKHRHVLQSPGDFHPDRIGVMIELAKCYRLQHKIEDSISMCDESLEGFATRKNREHPLARSLKDTRRRMVLHMERLVQGGVGDPEIDKLGAGLYNPLYVF
jgi:tetratricopeptide (TPR) repeat protein